MNKPSILFYPTTGYKSQFFLRMAWPAEQLAKNGYNVAVKDPRRIAKDWHPEKMVADFQLADIIVTHHPRKKSDVTMFEAAKLLNKKIIVDSDDFAYNVNPSNPVYGAVGLESVKDLWHDGVQLDRTAALRGHANMSTIMRMANACTFSTNYLAKQYEPHLGHDRSWVLPNSVNLEHFKRWERRAPFSEVRILWQGGASHFEDLAILVKPLYEICKKYPQVKVVTMGDSHPDLASVLEGRIEHHPWVDIDTFYTKYHSLDADINLCPLADNEFNKGKSNNKLIEAGIFKIPSVCSALADGPYNMDTMPENAVDRVMATDNWYEMIELLVVDGQLRRTIGERAFRTTSKIYNIENNWEYWADCFDKVHKGMVGEAIYRGR